MMKQGLTADKFSVSLLLKSVAEKMDRSKVKRGLDLVEKYLDTLLRPRVFWRVLSGTSSACPCCFRVSRSVECPSSRLLL